MFNKKTLFVVGAGASEEVGLPTGTDLMISIAEKLDLRFNANDPDLHKKGDPDIKSILRECAKQNNLPLNEYLREALKIRDGMSTALSIDNFIHSHSTNQRLVLCAKLAITKAILEAERKSDLDLDESPGQRQRFDHSRVRDKWYLPLFQKIHENVQIETLEKIFDNVSFITFNYDRCIEHYLYHALQNYFAITETHAAQLMQNLVISHPYGTVGALPWQNPTTNVSFGGLYQIANLTELANQIRTFTERVVDNPALAAIRRQVQEAEVVVFLGFGYHTLNMELLSPEIPSNMEIAFGTAFGISDISVKKAIVPRIYQMLKTGDHRATYIHNKLRCRELFSEHWYTLS
jgi:hypothetical protein